MAKMQDRQYRCLQGWGSTCWKCIDGSHQHNTEGKKPDANTTDSRVCSYKVPKQDSGEWPGKDTTGASGMLVLVLETS